MGFTTCFIRVWIYTTNSFIWTDVIARANKSWMCVDFSPENSTASVLWRWAQGRTACRIVSVKSQKHIEHITLHSHKLWITFTVQTPRSRATRCTELIEMPQGLPDPALPSPAKNDTSKLISISKFYVDLMDIWPKNRYRVDINREIDF